MGQRIRSIEGAINEAVLKFQTEIVGRGPESIRTMILKDMVIVRMKGSLSKEESYLVKHDRGRSLVKQVRQVLREQFSEEMEGIIERETGYKVVSSHSDISTKTGERIEIFILDHEFSLNE
ncbi:DUF2294 domain-containing protein [Alicyclobacillus dauci]|uniref:DUF2294 domain-containing protein n=1 Tax=Alicyclobacillus dauci TaxID=1475485 RepID=A0ABY6Z5X6_9BACL|nr:DUF2294 domain-containing protein [Alicyclobacillus dauci]WAH38303.1 DUF2294 domain-containing protein [Alicyclobacillus dauci]